MSAIPVLGKSEGVVRAFWQIADAPGIHGPDAVSPSRQVLPQDEMRHLAREPEAQ